MKSVQKAALSLIQDDLAFLYTLVVNSNKIHPTYWVELSPYIGIIVDGAEDWAKAFNNSEKIKFQFLHLVVKKNTIMNV